MLRLILTATVFTLTAPILSVAQTPQTLHEVMKSDQMRELKLDVKKGHRKNSAEWRKDNTNFAKLFLPGGGKNLLLWLNPERSDYFLPKTSLTKVKESYVLAVRKYLVDKTHDEILITIIVPAPEQLKAVEMGIFEEISRYDRPYINSSHHEELKIQGFKSTLFYSSNEQKILECSLLTRLSRGAILNLGIKYCADPHLLVKITDIFNIKNLDEKLNS